jgi:alcohol dehydrogenase
LSQAVESYWAVKSTEESKNFASEAIVLILEVLQDAVAGDKESRILMSKAAYLAGKAINITTTTAPHAISYPISIYCGLQHGHAVALTLGHFFEINYYCKDTNVIDFRGVDYLRNTMKELYNMFGVNSALECKNNWYILMDAIGLNSNMKDNGVLEKGRVDKILDNINIQRLSNNPVHVSRAMIKKILKNDM